MKKWNEVVTQIDLEIEHLYANRNFACGAEFYVYYLPSAPEHDGCIFIGKDKPANPEFTLALTERISGFKTKEQNKRLLYDTFKTLPILSY